MSLRTTGEEDKLCSEDTVIKVFGLKKYFKCRNKNKGVQCIRVKQTFFILYLLNVAAKVCK